MIPATVSGIPVLEVDSDQEASASDEGGSLDDSSQPSCAPGRINFGDSDEESDVETALSASGSELGSELATPSCIESAKEAEDAAAGRERDRTPTETDEVGPFSQPPQDVQSSPPRELTSAAGRERGYQGWARAATFGGWTETSRYFEYEAAREFGDGWRSGPRRTLSGGWSADFSRSGPCNLPNPMVDTTPRSFGQFPSPKVSYPYSTCFDYSPALGNLFYHNEASAGQLDGGGAASWGGPTSFSSSRLPASGHYPAAVASKYLSHGRALSWHVPRSSAWAGNPHDERPLDASSPPGEEVSELEAGSRTDVPQEDMHAHSKQRIEQMLESNLKSFDQLSLAGVTGSSLAGALKVGSSAMRAASPATQP